MRPGLGNARARDGPPGRVGCRPVRASSLAPRLLLCRRRCSSRACRDEQAGPRPRRAGAGVRAGGGDGRTGAGHLGAVERIRYLGTRVERGRDERGRTRCGSPTASRRPGHSPPGWQIFVHLVDARTGQMLANADHPLATPLEQWPVGELVQDVHVVALPPGAPRHPGAARLLARRPAAPGGSAPRPRTDSSGCAGRSSARRAPAGARGARPAHGHRRRRSTGCSTTRRGSARPRSRWWTASTGASPRSSAPRRGWSGTTRRSTSPSTARTRTSGARSRKRDDPLYTQDVVEIFIDADADGRTYDEIEVSPHNVVFDAYFPARRQGMDTLLGLGAAERGEGARHHRRRQRPRPGLDGGDAHPLRPAARRFRTCRRGRATGGASTSTGSSCPTGRTRRARPSRPLFVGDFHAVDRFAWLVFDAERLSRCESPSGSRPRSGRRGSPRKCRYPWSSSVSTTDSASSWLKPRRSTSASRILALPRRYPTGSPGPERPVELRATAPPDRGPRGSSPRRCALGVGARQGAGQRGDRLRPRNVSQRTPLGSQRDPDGPVHVGPQHLRPARPPALHHLGGGKAEAVSAPVGEERQPGRLGETRRGVLDVRDPWWGTFTTVASTDGRESSAGGTGVAGQEHRAPAGSEVEDEAPVVHRPERRSRSPAARAHAPSPRPAGARLRPRATPRAPTRPRPGRASTSGPRSMPAGSQSRSVGTSRSTLRRPSAWSGCGWDRATASSRRMPRSRR